MTIKFCTMNTASAKYYAVRGETLPFNITVDGMLIGTATNSTNTIAASSFYLANCGTTLTAAGNCSIEIKNIQSDSGVEFGTNINDTDLTTYISRQPILRVGSHIFGQWTNASTYQGYTATTAPTSGSWAAGDRVEVVVPVVAGTAGSQYMIVGYACTVAGSPGTWVAERTLTGT
jgi:hypothetical protein